MYTEGGSRKERNEFTYTESSDEVNYPRNETCFLLRRFHDILSKLFYKFGHLVATQPSYFIIVPIFLTLIGVTGIQKINYETDPEALFSPSNGQGQTERSVVEGHFPINYSTNFDPSRITRMTALTFVLVLPKDNGSIFRVDVFDEMVLLDDAIRNLTIEWQGSTYTYDDVCAKMNGQCIENSVLKLQEFMPEIENGSMMINYPIMVYPKVLAFSFGGAVVNESEGIMLEAKAVSLNYWFRDGDWKLKERSHLFEGKMLELLDKIDLELIKVAYFASRSLADEFENNANTVFSYATLAFMLMIGFSVGSMFLSDWVRSKLSVAVCGVVSASFATVCAFGFLMYCGVPFTGVNMATPFLMLGIGIDDMFVILSAWQRTQIQDEVPTRMAKTYCEAAVSITITSLTNMLSFIIGSATPFPAVQIFCIYTGVSVLFTYIFCITFFGGCLAVAGKMERSRRHAITGQPVLAKSETENLGCCYKFWCAGGINPEDPWNPKDNQDHAVMSFFRDYLGKALNMPSVKGLVILLFLLYIGGAIYGCTTVQEGLERKKMVLEDSYAVDFFEVENKYFRKFPPIRLQVIINEKVTYSDPQTMKELLELHETFESLNCTGSRIFSESWIRGFHNYLNRRPELRANITDEKSFINVLKSKYLGPNTREYLDVKFNDDETEIIASRFIVQAYNIPDSNADKDMMLTMRKTAEDSKFEVVVYHPLFVFFDQVYEPNMNGLEYRDFGVRLASKMVSTKKGPRVSSNYKYILVRYTTLQAIILATVVMMVVSLIFIPSPLCSLWVAFSIVSIEIGVVGYMSIWGVNLDAISMINLIMCVGFSVDFSAHISYSYLTVPASNSAQRVEQCLYNLGLPVVQGGISTIVGVLVLSFAPSYVFTTFFKIVFLVVFFGIMHALLLLPVMLSLLGPGSCGSKDKDTAPNVFIPEMLHHLGTSRSGSLSLCKDKNANSSKQLDMDSESMDRDLGLGSSESSSYGSLNEIKAASEQKNDRNIGGISNNAFFPENGECL